MHVLDFKSCGARKDWIFVLFAWRWLGLVAPAWKPGGLIDWRAIGGWLDECGGLVNGGLIILWLVMYFN